MSTLRLLLLVTMLGALFSIRADDGIGIDPNGGRRTAAIAGDHRCTIDPNGSPCVTATLDRGAGLDPDGRG